jgi:hypothetical protein
VQQQERGGSARPNQEGFDREVRVDECPDAASVGSTRRRDTPGSWQGPYKGRRAISAAATSKGSAMAKSSVTTR